MQQLEIQIANIQLVIGADDMIYDVNGNVLSSVYDVDGNELSKAYDIEGNLIFQKEPINLKVMTYNVGGWYTGTGNNVPSADDSAYYALQNAIMGGQNADILCLEEYWNSFSKAGRTALSLLEQYYPYIQTRNGTNTYFGRAICSKYPITNYVTNAFANESARYFDRAEVLVDDITLNVLVTHLGLTAETRQPQALQLFNYVQNYSNVILCGDFNIPISSVSDSEYVNDYKQFVDAGYHLANGGDLGFIETYTNSNGDGTWSCIDQIITSSNIAINSVTTDRTKVTDEIDDTIDHIPLIATVQIN